MKHGNIYFGAIRNGIKLYRSNYWVKCDLVNKHKLYGWPERIDFIGGKRSNACLNVIG